MAYRVPGAYAQFNRTAGPVNNPGSTRVLGLVGTGLNYFEVYNEPIRKSDKKSYDQLVHSNIFEVMSVTSQPKYFDRNSPEMVEYVQGEKFNLREGRYIAWEGIENYKQPTIIGLGDGGRVFEDKVECMVDPTTSYLLEDGEWLVEITYVDEPTMGKNGAYRVINNITKEIIGEYAVSATKRFNVIPGTELTIETTFIADDEGKSKTSVGDYILIKTEGIKTEIEAHAKINTTSDLSEQIQSLMVINPDNVLTNKYTIEIVDASIGRFTITNDEGFITYDGLVGAVGEYLETIPGISFIFDSLPEGVEDGDQVEIETTARLIDGVPGEDEIYYVSYKYRKADEDYGPKLFFDYDDVIAEYGNYDVTASSVVINSLTLGAEIAFQHGVNPIVCVQAKNDSDFEMRKAIDMLKRSLPGLDNINTIIPLSESPELGAYTMNHIDLMSSYEMGKERMTYLGAKRKQPIVKSATILDRSLGMVETAKSYANERVVFVVPGEIVREVRDLRTGKVNDRSLPGCYAAVGVASIGLVNDPAEPLTNKQLVGFKALKDLYTETEKNLLAEAGCLVLEQTGSTIKIRHGITTSTSDINSNEITLIQIKDYVIEACRKSTSELYVGNKNRPTIISDVELTITSILKQFISSEIILGYEGLSVKRNKDNPTQIDVRFEIEAVYPLNYINITFGFMAVS